VTPVRKLNEETSRWMMEFSNERGSLAILAKRVMAFREENEKYFTMKITHKRKGR